MRIPTGLHDTLFEWETLTAAIDDRGETKFIVKEPADLLDELKDTPLDYGFRLVTYPSGAFIHWGFMTDDLDDTPCVEYFFDLSHEHDEMLIRNMLERSGFAVCFFDDKLNLVCETVTRFDHKGRYRLETALEDGLSHLERIPVRQRSFRRALAQFLDESSE